MILFDHINNNEENQNSLDIIDSSPKTKINYISENSQGKLCHNLKKNYRSNKDMGNFDYIGDLDKFFSDIKSSDPRNKYIYTSKKSKTLCKKPIKSNKFFDDCGKKNIFDISENLTNNTNSIKKILKENVDRVESRRQHVNDFMCNNNNNNMQPAYLAQFDAQTFDSEGLPSAPNDIYCTSDKAKLADLERKLSSDEGWTYCDKQPMTYGIVPDNQLTHDNMTPFFRTKYGYGSNDLQNETVMNLKNELFTGNLMGTWNKKKEIKPLFAPMANLTHPYGTPVRTEEEISRYRPGRYLQGQKPFDPVRDTPGLGLEANEVGTHGYHSMVRVFDKTVDEIRVKPKITYEGRIIEGQRGQERPQQAPVITYRPTTYKTTTEDDLLPTDNVVDGPKARDNFIMKATDRADQHFEYTGGAYTSADAVGRNVPEYMRPKIKYSNKPTFILPKPLQKFSKVEAKFNPNINSYDTSATIKDLTIHNNHVGTCSAPGSTTYANLTDTAKTTIREITSAVPQTHTNIAPNTMRGTAQPMDVTRATVKETTIENKLNPHAASLSNMQRVYYNDVAKTTTKETTSEPVVPMNTVQMTNIYANLTDNAKTTIRETTVGIPYQTTITPINQQQRAPNPSDVAKTTVKEITVNIPYQTSITPINQQQRAPNPSDVARTTVRETTVNIPYQTTITPINQQQRAPNPSDVARTTVRETTVGIPYQTTITPVNQQQRAPNPSDVARTTTRETTVQTPWNNFATPVNQQQRAPNPSDIARTTVKETTVNIPYQTTVTPVNQQQRAPNQSDVARTTVKETTVGIPYQTTVTPINQQQRAPDPSDVARTTIRETTVGIPYQTTITPVNQQQRAPGPSDIARTTVKETTVDIPYQTTVTPVNQQQRAPNLSDIAKTTVKETTVGIPYQTTITPINQQQRAPDPSDVARTTIRETTVGIPYQTIITPVNQQQRAPNPSDIARTTVRETTVGIPYQTNLTAINQQQRAPNPSDVARTTIKETTVAIPYNTNTSGINQSQGKAFTFDRTPLKTTTKEQTVAIPRNTQVVAVGQAQRAPHPQDKAKTTIRETTVQIPYNTHVVAVGQSQRAPNSSDVAKTTVRETTVAIPYNTNTTAIGQATGKATTFDRTPLKTTTKETTIDNEYIGAVNNDVKGKGYGYMAENMFAPNTNKQFTCQEVYIAPLQGESKNRSYDDAYNAQIDDRKDLLHWYYEPTACGVNMGPDPEYLNVQLRNDNNIAHGPMIGYSVNNQLGRLKTHTQIKPIENVCSDRFMDSMVLAQLESNPYNIPFYGKI